MFKIYAKLLGLSLLLCSVFISPIGFAEQQATSDKTSNKQWYVCLQPYVLCAHAKCTPIPTDPGKARCTCITKYGYSTGNQPCDKRKVMTNAQGQKILMVAYSFAEMETNPIMTCTAPIPWAYCLNTLCTINLQSPSIAHCVCQIMHKGTFQTQGGHCKLNACSNALWSGLSSQDINAAQTSLSKQMGLDSIPLKRCPTPADLKIEDSLPL